METCSVCEGLIQQGKSRQEAQVEHDNRERWKAESVERLRGVKGVSAGGRPFTHTEIIASENGEVVRP